MIKILDLGSHVESTGEVRVSLIDSSLVKTASNDIQDAWNNLEREDAKAYLHVLAMTAIGWYSCNNNGDAFTEEDLREFHPSFVVDANVFMHHANKDPKKSYGKVVYSFYNENMHRVELIMALEKAKAPDIVATIKRDEPIAVSMGVRVKFDKCSICGNESKTRVDYCDHLKYNMKKILEDGRQVYALNPGPLSFFDISIVNKPADRTAWALQKAASCIQEQNSKTSAERGEEYEDHMQKVSALTKFSEILKELEATPIELKDGDDSFKVHRVLIDEAQKGQVDFELPQLSFDEMEGSGLAPGSILQKLVENGVAPSLGELAFTAGKHCMGDNFNSTTHIPMLMDNLQTSTKMLLHKPSIMGSLISSLLGNIQAGGGAEGIHITMDIQPMAKKRRSMVLHLVGDQQPRYEKMASALLKELPVATQRVSRLQDDMPLSGARRGLSRSITTRGPAGTERLSVRGSDGETYHTTRAAARAARGINMVPDTVKGLTTAGLTLAAIGAVMSNTSTAAKFVITPLLAALALGSARVTTQNIVETEQGIEVPVNTLFHRVKESSEKIAVDSSLLAPVLGASLPAALGLDYVYNKHIKHRKNPYYREGMSVTGRVVDKAGDSVINHPVTSLSVGGILGGAVLGALRAAKRNG